MNYEMDLPEMPKEPRWPWLLKIGIVVAALAIIMPVLTTVATEWLWYREQGHTEVYWTMFWGQWLLGLAVGIGFFVFVFLNLAVALRNTEDAVWVQFGQQLRARAMYMFDRVLRRGAFWAGGMTAALFAWLLGMTAAKYWPQFLLFLRARPVGTTEPIFSRDIGFYMFKLPVWELFNHWLYFTLLFTLIGATIIYLVTRSITFAHRKFIVSRKAQAHLSLILALLFISKAVGYHLARFGMMFAESGLFTGPGFTDVHARIPALSVLTAVALLAAVAMLVNIRQRKILLPAAAIAGLIVLSFLAQQIYPALLYRLRVEPNELELETKYLKQHIRMTREAYGLEGIRRVEFPATQQVTPAELASTPVTVNNIRLWDPRPLLETYRQQQVLRQYYRIENVDVDRYFLDGQMRQVMVAAREMDIDKATEMGIQKSWLNRHLMYTHGYGLVMSPVNAIDVDKGHPIYFIKDIPPKSTYPELQVTRPELYFGEMDSDYIVVRTTLEEFNYPGEGEENEFTTYDGTAGIQLRNRALRALMAWQFKDVNLLISEYLTSESRIVFRRQIIDRAQALAPFLHFDRDPYLVIGRDGKLYWLIDAYTRSARYPYSRYTALEVARGQLVRTNYVRNSVKVVVDAYNGTTRFYTVDGEEPFINTWSKVFPRLFQPMSEMPAGLENHVRVPEGLFNAVSEVYRRYHMTVPRTFYQDEDPWNIPLESTASGVDEYGQQFKVKRPAYYMVMSLPGQEEPEYLLIRPYTPKNRKNMISWLGARNDPQHLGEMLIFNFPKQSLVYGPEQIEGQISQDPEIIAAFSLWRQAVFMGNLMVIPVGSTVLYVQPLYLEAAESRLPELQRVIVADQQRIIMRRTLDEALAALTRGVTAGSAMPPTPVPIPGVTRPSPPPEDGNLRDHARAAREHYRKALEAQRKGDWTTFGKELEAMDKELEAMDR